MAVSVAGVARRWILCWSMAIAHAFLADPITSTAADWLGLRCGGGAGSFAAVYDLRWMGARYMSLHWNV